MHQHIKIKGAFVLKTNKYEKIKISTETAFLQNRC